MNTKSNPPPEPARARVQLNSRIPAEMDERMRQFQHDHRMTRQALLERAIDEYLNRHSKKH